MTRQLNVTLVLVMFMIPAYSAFGSDYVGFGKCFDCQFNLWQSSGHPWKLRKVEKVRYAKLPMPPGYSCDDISYGIGGAVKKARFIDKSG